MTQVERFPLLSGGADLNGRYACARGGCRDRVYRYGICRYHFLQVEIKNLVTAGVVECVYAVLAPDINAVKIGMSRCPESRIDSLTTGSPVKIELMGAVPGSKAIEQALHKLLAEYFIKGEWFRYEGDAKRVADALATNNIDEFEAVLDSL